MAHNAYSEETRSASTEKTILGAGQNRLSGLELQNRISGILQKDENIIPAKMPPLTEQLCRIIGDYTFEIEKRLAKADPDFGNLEPESSQRRAVLLELLSAGQYREFELYEPINMVLDDLRVRTETYQQLYSAARMAFCSDLDFVQRVAYAARSFPFFSALKRLLLKPYRPGQTYYEYICNFSGKEPSRKIKNAAKTGNYQFENKEAVRLLDKLVLHETGKKNVFRKWEDNGWLPIDIQSDTVFACAYAFSLPLFSQTADDMNMTADYLFEHVESSVTDVLNAEQDILRFGLWAGIRYQEAARLTDAYNAYFDAREAKAPASNRSTVNAAIGQFFQGQNRDPSAFFGLLTSHGVKPVVKTSSGRGRIQKEDTHLKENLLDLRTRAVQRYIQDIFDLTESVDPETMLIYC
ncbi:MAG: hypothetical protein J5722_11770, partial [Oscillospiraceae bacterium]|nr:hypothetical protein [Oscillospiraceae bacterium]